MDGHSHKSQHSWAAPPTGRQRTRAGEHGDDRQGDLASALDAQGLPDVAQVAGHQLALARLQGL